MCDNFDISDGIVYQYLCLIKIYETMVQFYVMVKINFEIYTMCGIVALSFNTCLVFFWYLLCLPSKGVQCG